MTHAHAHTHNTHSLRGLDMSPYMLEAAVQPDNPPVYDLYATVNHYGISYGGHYSAIVKPPTAMETGAKGSHFREACGTE